MVMFISEERPGNPHGFLGGLAIIFSLAASSLTSVFLEFNDFHEVSVLFHRNRCFEN